MKLLPTLLLATSLGLFVTLGPRTGGTPRAAACHPCLTQLQLSVTSLGQWADQTSDEDIQFRIEGEPGAWVCLLGRAFLVPPEPGSQSEASYEALTERFGAQLAPVEGVLWHNQEASIQSTLLDARHASVAGPNANEDSVKSEFQPLFAESEATSASRNWLGHSPIWVQRQTQGHPTSIGQWERMLSPKAQLDDVFSSFNIMQHAVQTQMIPTDANEFLKGYPPGGDQSWMNLAVASGLLRVDVQVLGLRSPVIGPEQHGTTELSSPGLIGVPALPPTVRLSNNIRLGIFVGSPGSGGNGAGFAGHGAPIELDVAGYVAPVGLMLRTDDSTLHFLAGDLIDVGRARFEIPINAASGPATIRWISNAYGRFGPQGAPWGNVFILGND